MAQTALSGSRPPRRPARDPRGGAAGGAAGRGRFLVLSGEAGIGKTRLARELAGRARDVGWTVMAGRCSEAELSLPYLPFVEAIGNYLTGQDTGQVAARLGPRGSGARGAVSAAVLGPEPRGGDPGQAKLRLFEAIVSLLGTTAAEGALLLVVEDVNWADASSTRSG